MKKSNVLVMVAAMMCAAMARADMISVAAGGDIAAAVELANAGDVIELAPGAYTLTDEVTITNAITVKGTAPASFVTITAASGKRLFSLKNAGAVLSGVTLTGGNASIGGGVYVTAGTVQDSIITGNRATSGGNAGAGVWLQGSDSVLRRCRIENNTTGGYGGGVYFLSGATIESCSISGNKASWGGGLYGDNSSEVSVVSHCNIRENSVSNGGADVYDYAQSVNYKYYYCFFGTSAARKKTSELIGCITGGGIGELALKGKASPITGLPQLQNRDLNGVSFHSTAPSVGCTEYDTDGLNVLWTGASVGGLGSAAEAAFAYENRPEGTAVATALYDPVGTLVGGSATGADFSFTVTDVIGAYMLAVTVMENGETREMFQTPFVGGPSELHVSPTGTAVSPYATEETALTDIQTAVDLCIPGGTVIVHDGAYQLASTLKIERPVTVRSANGRDRATLKPASANGVRLVYINNAAALLDGFTLTGGRARDVLTGNSHGGGVYIDAAGGTVDNCLIEKCGVGYDTTHGIAVRLSATNAVLRRTIVRKNEGDGSWGSIYMNNGGLVDNCLVYGNMAPFGAGVYIEENGARGVILNSTIMDNAGGGSGSDIGNDVYVFKSGSAITNSIVGSLRHNGCDGKCTSVRLLRSASFKDAANGDYTPLVDDLNILDQGIAYDGMPATDVYGNPRVSGSAVDIGAVELRAEKLLVGARVDKVAELFFDGQTFTLTPTVTGAKGTVSLDWVITANHGRITARETTAENETLVFAPTGPGAYSVTVTADDGTQTSEPAVYENMFVAGAAEVFVDEKGGNVYPYASSATAAHDFADAWELVTTSGVVHVAAGLYRPSKQLALLGPIQVLGAGRDVTTLRLKDGANDRVAELNDSAALIRGCTLSGGRLGKPSGRNGCGVKFGGKGGTVEDCRITDNRADGYQQYGGGAAFASGSKGVLRRTVIDNNVVNVGEGYGGGIYTAGGGVVDNCLVVSNRSSWGGGFYQNGALNATNCTIIGNTGDAAAIYLCNSDVWKASRIVNTIIRPQAGVVMSIWVSTNGVDKVFSHCAITHFSNTSQTFVFPEENGNTHVVPEFVDEAHGDYHLKHRSPLRKAGLVTPDMKRQTDLDGKPRVSSGVVDIGCYQISFGGMTFMIR